MIMKGFRFREMDIVEELRQNRDSGAKRLVSEYKAGLMSLARRFCVNESDAEELVNATFAKVVDNIDDYLEQSAFFAWMCQILTNLFRESVRRKSNKNEIFSGDVPEVADDGAQEEIFRNLDHSLLRDAIRELPADQRELLLLHYFMDMPVAKIAKFLSIPNGTVFSRLHYARKALAAKLGAAAMALAPTRCSAPTTTGRGRPSRPSATLASFPIATFSSPDTTTASARPPRTRPRPCVPPSRWTSTTSGRPRTSQNFFSPAWRGGCQPNPRRESTNTNSSF